MNNLFLFKQKIIKFRLQSIFLIFFVISLFLRLYYLHINEPLCMSGDCERYVCTAYSLLSGKGFFSGEGYDFVLPPLYPLFLASIFYLFGKNLLVVVYFQIVLNVLSCFLIYKIAEKLFNRKVALLSTLIAIVYPGYIYYSTKILTENNFIFLLLLFVYFIIKYKEKPCYKNLILASFFFGLSNLQRPVLLYFIPFIPIYLINSNYFRKDTNNKLGYSKRLLMCIWSGIKPTIVLSIIFFAILSPWMIRNYMKYRSIILVSSHGAANLYVAYSKYTNPSVFINTNRLMCDPNYMEIEKSNMSQKDKNALFFNIFLENIKNYPEIIYYSGIEKFKLYWTPVIFNNYQKPLLDSFSNIEKLLLTPLIIIGVLLSLFRFKKAGIIHLILLYHSLLFSVSLSVGMARGRLAIMFAVFIMFSYTIYLLLKGPSLLFLPQTLRYCKLYLKYIILVIVIISSFCLALFILFGNQKIAGNYGSVYFGSWRQINLCKEGFQYEFDILDDSSSITCASLNIFVVFENDKWFDRITMNNIVIFDLNSHRYQYRISRTKEGWISIPIKPSHLVKSKNLLIFHQTQDCSSSQSVSVAFDKKGNRYIKVEKDSQWGKKRISGEMMLYIKYRKPIYR